MLEFLCTCGYAFRLQDDQAGGLIPCPECGRLDDVPTHAELNQNTPGKAEELEFKPEGPSSIDPHLAEDRAQTLSPVLRPLHEAVLNRSTDEPIPVIEIKVDASTPNNAEIPLAKPALHYATGETFDRIRFGELFARLLSPLNVTVLLGILCVQALLIPLSLVALAGLNYLGMAVGMMAAPFLAHYGNVIEEIGPFGRDELPRLLRDLEWHEDVWAPFIGMLSALLICYGPALLSYTTSAQNPALAPVGAGLAIVLAVAGTFILPAVMLTLITSGTFHNLRPDRLRGLVEACGKDYIKLVGIWAGSATVYILGCIGTCFALCSAIETIAVPKWLKSWSTMAPVLVAGIVLLHYYCICLGMVYRVHYNQFPWVLQRHVATRKKDHTVELPPSRTRRTGQLRPKPTHSRRADRPHP